MIAAKYGLNYNYQKWVYEKSVVEKFKNFRKAAALSKIKSLN
jgi:hypothetical protein